MEIINKTNANINDGEVINSLVDRRCAIYIRVPSVVFSKEQRRDLIEYQRMTCKKFIAARGWMCNLVYTDSGSSISPDRIGIHRLYQSCHFGDIDTVVFLNNKILSKSKGLFNMIKNQVNLRHPINIISLNDYNMYDEYLELLSDIEYLFGLENSRRMKTNVSYMMEG